MRELLIGTSNKGKVLEIDLALKDLPFKLVHFGDAFPEGYDVEESAETLEGNAIIKAIMFGKRSHKLTLADDTGVEIDALDGEPGVRSARFAPGTDEDRYRKLLEMMKDVPDDKRGGQLRCVLAIYDPARDKVRTCEGVMRIRVAREPKGELGFGYDPILLVEEAGKMHAEQTTEERNAMSHRGKALAKAREILLKEFV